jgi:hypothetical protein
LNRDGALRWSLQGCENEPGVYNTFGLQRGLRTTTADAARDAAAHGDIRMGIVSYCPNGHRVKVKDFQAGRRVLCPTCGDRFRIPEASTGPGGPATAHAASSPAAIASATAALEPPLDPALPLARFVPLDPALIVTLPRALPFGSARAKALVAESGMQDHAAKEAHEPATATAAERFEAEPFETEGPTDAALQPLHPAIADRPDLSWRIAYPGGEPSEPVDATTMQEWIAGGQAEGTELVWRTDWAEWLPVCGVFPEFFPEA